MLIKTFENASEVYFISDLHFCHGNVIKYNNRPFETVQEMNEQLIENWNKTVPDYAHVFILGDFVFANKNRWKRILDRLTGHKHLILGNHDHLEDIPEECFDSICDICKVSIKISDNNWKTFILSHRPFLCWEGNERGTIALSGHIHMGPDREKTCTNGDVVLWNLVKDYGLRYDVGVDNNNYHPISTIEILEKINNDANSI